MEGSGVARALRYRVKGTFYQLLMAIALRGLSIHTARKAHEGFELRMFNCEYSAICPVLAFNSCSGDQLYGLLRAYSAH